MFAGSHQLTVDDKGRVAIPVRFRQHLLEKYGAQVFVTRSYFKCIEIYPAAQFHAVVAQFEQMQDRRKADLAMQVFFGSAFETEIDKQGRLMLPPMLRKLAELDSQAVAVGQNKRIEIWSEDNWIKKFSGGEGEELADAFSDVKR